MNNNRNRSNARLLRFFANAAQQNAAGARGGAGVLAGMRQAAPRQASPFHHRRRGNYAPRRAASPNRGNLGQQVARVRNANQAAAIVANATPSELSRLALPALLMLGLLLLGASRLASIFRRNAGATTDQLKTNLTWNLTRGMGR